MPTIGHGRLRNALLYALLIWTALTTVVFWLPTLRGAFDGPSYEWGLFGFGGRGVSGDYWFPVLGSAIALCAQYLAWRGPRLPFYVLILGWSGFLAAGMLSLAVGNPGSLRFRGDTLGIDISIAVLGPALFGLWAVLAAIWIGLDVRGRATRTMTSWSNRNSRWLIALLALLPIQFVLLRFGEPHGLSDQIGVLVTIVQWLLVVAAFGPKPVSRREVAAVAT